MGTKTVSKMCGTCGGGGSHYDYSAGVSSTCYSCGGSGTTTETVWVDPPPVSAPSSPESDGVITGSQEYAGDEHKTEKILANLITATVFFGLLYYNHNYNALEPVWNLGIACVVAAITNYLLHGPLRPLVTLLKWLIGLGIALFIVSWFRAQ